MGVCFEGLGCLLSTSGPTCLSDAATSSLCSPRPHSAGLHHSDGGAALLRVLRSQDRVLGFAAQVFLVNPCHGCILCLVVLRACGYKPQESTCFVEALAAVACDHVIVLSDLILLVGHCCSPLIL